MKEVDREYMTSPRRIATGKHINFKRFKVLKLCIKPKAVGKLRLSVISDGHASRNHVKRKIKAVDRQTLACQLPYKFIQDTFKHPKYIIICDPFPFPVGLPDIMLDTQLKLISDK